MGDQSDQVDRSLRLVVEFAKRREDAPVAHVEEVRRLDDVPDGVELRGVHEHGREDGALRALVVGEPDGCFGHRGHPLRQRPKRDDGA